MSDRLEWPDGRIDDLARRVDALAAMPIEMERLKGSLDGLKGSVERLTRKLDKLAGDPIEESRLRRRIVFQIVLGSLVTALIVTGCYFALGVIPVR